MEDYQHQLDSIVEAGPPVGGDLSLTQFLEQENERVTEKLMAKFKKNAMGEETDEYIARLKLRL